MGKGLIFIHVAGEFTNLFILLENVYFFYTNPTP